MKMKRGFIGCLLSIFVILTMFSGCNVGSTDGGEADTVLGGGSSVLRIVSGSENSELEPILEEFSDREHVRIEMTYMGSLDIMRLLGEEDIPYDAVWPASSLWLTVGDTEHRIKHAESISISPVVFGIRKSLAEELGFVGREVSVNDLLEAIRNGKLRFCMTSATQSNSGASAYIGFLYALLGNPEVITSEDLQSDELRAQMQELLSGVDRSSGSSDWLKDMFLQGDYDAMVNYECLVIQANRELEERGEEPLYVVYPYDGLSHGGFAPGLCGQRGRWPGGTVFKIAGIPAVGGCAGRDPAHRPPFWLHRGFGEKQGCIPGRLGPAARPGALPHQNASCRCAV